ncbi:MAG: hypothetical protein U1E73_07745 [Planctomycetota bacterium]
MPDRGADGGIAGAERNPARPAVGRLAPVSGSDAGRIRLHVLGFDVLVAGRAEHVDLDERLDVALLDNAVDQPLRSRRLALSVTLANHLPSSSIIASTTWLSPPRSSSTREPRVALPRSSMRAAPLP